MKAKELVRILEKYPELEVEIIKMSAYDDNISSEKINSVDLFRQDRTEMMRL